MENAVGFQSPPNAIAQFCQCWNVQDRFGSVFGMIFVRYQKRLRPFGSEMDVSQEGGSSALNTLRRENFNNLRGSTYRLAIISGFWN